MTDEKHHKKISKFLSLVLRHKPQTIGIELDDQGWTDVQTLLDKMNEADRKVDFETLVAVVTNNDKKRFAFNDDRTKIRASQGHSVKIELGYEPQVPPTILYHGTATRFTHSIFKSGLEKRGRQHVHLSADVPTAKNVGTRHGVPVILEVLASEMHTEGHKFFISENGVWLTEAVPAKFLRRLEET